MKKDEIMKTEDVKDLAIMNAEGNSGFEDMGQEDVTMPMLLISQQLSAVVANDKVQAGHFYNSVTGEDYGEAIKFVVIRFSKMWYEWAPDMGGLIGIHEPYSIKVIGDKFSGMKSEAGNDVVETWCYVVMLPDHPEAGYLLFNSSPGNIRYLKSLNTQMKYLRLPNGKPAPIYGAIWSAKLGKDKNKKGQSYYSCSEGGKSSFSFVSFISNEIYEHFVKPALTMQMKQDVAQSPAETPEY